MPEEVAEGVLVHMTSEAALELVEMMRGVEDMDVTVSHRDRAIRIRIHDGCMYVDKGEPLEASERLDDGCDEEEGVLTDKEKLN